MTWHPDTWGPYRPTLTQQSRRIKPVSSEQFFKLRDVVLRLETILQLDDNLRDLGYTFSSILPPSCKGYPIFRPNYWGKKQPLGQGPTTTALRRPPASLLDASHARDGAAVPRLSPLSATPPLPHPIVHPARAAEAQTSAAAPASAQLQTNAAAGAGSSGREDSGTAGPPAD